MLNQTAVSEFILLGPTDMQGLQHFFFISFLLLYFTSLLGNGAIVAIVISEPRLDTLMYFFLGNLSCLDIFCSAVTAPKMLTGFLFGHQPISFSACFAQLHLFHFLGSTKAVLLAAMAYDHYVAICNPLRYVLVMSPRTCLLLALASWSPAFVHATMHSVMTSQLSFCDRNHIHHFCCDIKPLLNLACGSTSLNMTLLSAVTTSIVLVSITLIVLSHLYITSFLFCNVQSQEGRWKPFSTCISHLIIVALLYIPVPFNYAPPSSVSSPGMDVQVSLMYSAVTPALNPLIYTLSNQEVRSALKKMLGRQPFPRGK
ncbi:LOW QUALITY PROTEIN: olfactory receptor 12D2-like [Pezoporus wallicus]|uniref:LOW QUALITY PROTEIN: olfactory receptor 12D2-like n=1 Tax=Pezoporus wallicus TaxID=35540 RepID=UPI0025511D6E|nr:LOW QUALITY PROTEIN: olfactory receptor 12D2-like [Pezoporus wallicus]XP_057278119.1 LOW QUALITY PROTEIN: olfactory receptor 12D2-like [Pezoporus wallicus]XP_061302402.1 LOW QUALITY PROTEIN: olfactory receptor 12D2-like [Pezoporus flaviventris]XP_061303451.1 LOW QUALITY PROTEIN: olfactory receptor 12D2-like [Pezoporus flaviventris]